MRRDLVLTGSAFLLRLFLWINVAAGIGFAAALVFSVAGQEMLVALLTRKYGTWIDLDALMLAVRVMLVLGVVASVLGWPIFTRLRAMIDTVAAGDPFSAENARRLQTIGWGLLGWQLLDLCFGALTNWIARIGADSATWTPGLVGWVVVLLVFVLARVFAVGTAMRDELEGTI